MEFDPQLKKFDYMEENEKLLGKLRRAITRNGSRVELRVLRSLMNAETANIRAKWYAGDETRNYAQKRKYLREAIRELPETGWKFYFQREPNTFSRYIFYVMLPGGLQVSWHGLNYEQDMEGVPEDYTIQWDGCEGVTLERIVSTIRNFLNKE